MQVRIEETKRNSIEAAFTVFYSNTKKNVSLNIVGRGKRTNGQLVYKYDTDMSAQHMDSVTCCCPTSGE